MDFLQILEDFLKQRKTNSSHSTSYTSKLFQEGRDRILKKIGEEAGEVIIAAKNNKQELIYESADLLFHLILLCVHEGIEFQDIIDELKRRHEH